MKRWKHNLSNYHLTSCDLGEIIPVGCLEVIPGDTIQMQTSALIRVTPQLKPVMHPVAVNIKHFYVTNRTLWTGWEDFITGESATAPPTISGAAYSEGTLQDYLGVYDDASNDYSALPLRAYNDIWNNFFQDQDLQSEVSEDQKTILKCNWEKDYFTASRPWAQKGDAVTLPLGTQAPVKGIGKSNQTYDESSVTVYESGETSSTTFDTARRIDFGAANSNYYVDGTASTSGFPNIYADLSDADALDIREFREAFALQRYQEARAKYGSDYIDYLNYIGVNGNKLDARLQRPEYLAGGRQTLQFSEVLQTSNDGTNGAVGDLSGHGIAALRANKFRKYIPEHGWIITLLYARPKAIYTQACPRKFNKTTKEDFFQKELVNVGAQEILNKEVYAPHTTPAGTFSYGDRYGEYRSEPSTVSAEFRNSTSYDWHFGRIFSSDPALNEAFIQCDPTKRVFNEQTEDSLWMMINHSIQARRPVPPAAPGALR
jgi:hypothetical protein